MVLEERILPRSSKRHEPDARRQAESLDRFRRGFHAAGIRSSGSMRGEILLGAIHFEARLPFVVNLDKVKTEGLQIFGGVFGELGQMLFIAGLRMLFHVPCAKPRVLRRQLDGINFCDGIGIRLQTKPRVVEIADGEHFCRCAFSGLEAQPPVIELRPDSKSVSLNRGKNHTAAPVVRQPTGDDAASRLGFDDTQECITPGIFSRFQQPARAQGTKLRQRFTQIHAGGNVRDVVQHNRLGATVAKGRAKGDERTSGV